MPTKDGQVRPKAGHGLGSAVDANTMRTKPARNRVTTAKPARNRNRVVPPAPARRPK